MLLKEGKKCFLFLGIVVGLIWGSCTRSPSEKLTIATAANMQFAMEALVKSFEKQTDIKSDLIISSSGKLTAQIKEGAPYDVFVSADSKYPNTLFQDSLTTIAPEIYAYGKLVLWTMFETIPPALASLEHPKIKHIAIANPKTAPYGQAAWDVIHAMKAEHGVIPKLVFGESVAQVNQFVYSKSAELGFTAMSVVQSPSMEHKGNWLEVDSTLYTPIEQSVVVLNQSSNLKDANQFKQFLFSKEAQNILSNFGYLVPSEH